ncbi:MAG: hypothetical protein WDM96_11680 [Lacunisphaera sp.]
MGRSVLHRLCFSPGIILLFLAVTSSHEPTLFRSASAPSPARAFDAVIFDMDGVITRTAEVHSRAWKQMFDDYLRRRAEWGHEPFREFTHAEDYLRYVDGRPRYQGVEAFLLSRGIVLPHGAATTCRAAKPSAASATGRTRSSTKSSPAMAPASTIPRSA